MRAVQRLVHTQPGSGILDWGRDRRFLENGGSVYFERNPGDEEGGLLEAATPECRGPSQLLLYHKANDRLLNDACALASEELGLPITLVKNCRDAFGNVYGAQESYETTVATGPWLGLWRLAVGCLAPLALLIALTQWALIASFLLVGALLGIAHLCLALVSPLWSGALPLADRAWSLWFATLNRLDYALAATVYLPAGLAFGVLVRTVAWRPHRHGGLGFLVSRSVVSGGGTLEADGRYTLSEKAGAMHRIARWTVFPSDRGVLEVGHLVKPLLQLAWGQWRPYVALFRPLQRFQLGLSDANACDVAEYLKVGTTSLVLDLAEAGRLTDAPVPADPVAAARQLAADPTLQAAIPLTDGSTATALELQRFYVDAARAWLDEADAVSLEASELVRTWARVLDALETDPDALVGQLDWVTKRALLERAQDLDPAARKKIDLRYHELGEGYHTWLREAGLSRQLVAEEDVRAAVHHPPSNTPARHRGALIRQLSESGTEGRVSWDEVHTQGKVIDLRDRFRRSDPDS